jgi:hypothetical protein
MHSKLTQKNIHIENSDVAKLLSLLPIILQKPGRLSMDAPTSAELGETYVYLKLK